MILAEYIDRRLALLSSEILTVYTKEYGRTDVVPVEYLASIPVVDDLPAQKGEWIVYCRQSLGAYRYGIKCSRCGKEYAYADTSYPHFCPNCGANMKVV